MYVEQPSSYLAHHGVKGQKWGVRRYQNLDGTLMNHQRYNKHWRYTNIDGSLNERGKVHKLKYVEKQIKKNDKYYGKQIKKYDKKIEKYKDNKELQNQFKKFKEGAEYTRKNVNDYIKTMNFDEIRENETKARTTALKVAGVTLGVAATTGASVAIPRTAKIAAEKAGRVDPNTLVDQVIALSETPTGRKLESYVNNGIRLTADAKSYVTAIYLDETMTRLDQAGVPQRANAMLKETLDGVGDSAKTNATKRILRSL